MKGKVYRNSNKRWKVWKKQSLIGRDLSLHMNMLNLQKSKILLNKLKRKLKRRNKRPLKKQKKNPSFKMLTPKRINKKMLQNKMMKWFNSRNKKKNLGQKKRLKILKNGQMLIVWYQNSKRYKLIYKQNKWHWIKKVIYSMLLLNLLSKRK